MAIGTAVRVVRPVGVVVSGAAIPKSLLFGSLSRAKIKSNLGYKIMMRTSKTITESLF